MMNNGNKITAIMAILCVSLVHAGAFMGLSSAEDSEMVMMQEGGASHLTMHQFQLSGTVEETDGNAEDSVMESEESIVDMKEEIIEELPEEPVIQPEPIVEPELIPEPEKVPEPVKEPKPEVVATKAPSETKVEQPKVVEKPQTAPKPTSQTAPKPQRQTPKAESTARAVQTAKAVYSESEVSVLNKPTPSYPRAAMQRKMQGTVELLVGINESGAATSVTVSRSSGHDLLDKTAVKTAYGIRLKPFKINGTAIPIQVKIQYQFKL